MGRSPAAVGVHQGDPGHAGDAAQADPRDQSQLQHQDHYRRCRLLRRWCRRVQRHVLPQRDQVGVGLLACPVYGVVWCDLQVVVVWCLPPGVLPSCAQRTEQVH